MNARTPIPFALIIIALALSIAATAAAGQGASTEAIDAYVASCVATYRIPGLSFALVEGGKTVFVKGYGEASRGKAATADTRYIIGSTSKMFTALAVLRLVEEGKVELDVPYKRYVPEFKLAGPGEAEKISVRHLLNMTSGLTDRGLAPLSAGKSSPEAELVRLRAGVLAAEPGSLYHYYTVNYRLLALLVERVSGRGIAEYVGSEVFAPLGMSSSGVGLSDSGSPSGAIPREAVAQGHGVFLGLPIARSQEIRVSAFASGMMVSTARDIGKFLEAEIAVREGGRPLGAVSARSLSASWSAPAGVRFSPSESLGEGVGYAMGWMAIGDGSGGLRLFHGGALENYQSAFFLDPERRIGFAILMNQGGISAQASINALRNGLLALLEGRDPGSLPGRPTVAVFAAILLASLAYWAFRILRLGAWRKKAARRATERGRPAARDLVATCLEFAVAAGFVFGLVPLGNAIMGDYTDWTMISGLAPDALCALPVILAGAVVVTALKAISLARIGNLVFAAP